MSGAPGSRPTIRIAAALIDDGAGRIFLVRKAGTHAFMQAGGKIEPSETPIDALCRELAEELNWTLDPSAPRYIGVFFSEAANEPGHLLEAELFHIRTCEALRPAAEIEEAIWVSSDQARALSLAPFTADHVLPLFERLQLG
jgi:8-oxo-dGTP diphosphatase